MGTSGVCLEIFLDHPLTATERRPRNTYAAGGHGNPCCCHFPDLPSGQPPPLPGSDAPASRPSFAGQSGHQARVADGFPPRWLAIPDCGFLGGGKTAKGGKLRAKPFSQLFFREGQRSGQSPPGSKRECFGQGLSRSSCRLPFPQPDRGFCSSALPGNPLGSTHDFRPSGSQEHCLSRSNPRSLKLRAVLNLGEFNWEQNRPGRIF